MLLTQKLIEHLNIETFKTITQTTNSYAGIIQE